MSTTPPASPDPGASARHDPLVGKRLGSYEVLARVARGGMGVVYRARHVYIDKVVALKVLDPALAARKDLIERFRTEAQSLARVEHENVVKVNDIVETDGLHFIVMDFVEGVNLRTTIKERGPLKPKELLSVARQTAEALLFAHRQGILHRDIKPENIIMSPRGVCKLTDFGLAGDLRLIHEGHEGALNFGTPAYSAPEILRRQTPDARSDIFGFGATMYHLATGETPFGPNNAQAIALRQRQGAELLEARRPDLPLSLCTLFQACLAYNPAERPLDFEEILQRLPKRIVERATPDTPTAPSGPLTTESLPASGGQRALVIVAALAGFAAFVIVGALLISRLGGVPPDAKGVPDDSGADGTPKPAANTSNAATDGRLPKDDGTKVIKPAVTPDEEAFNQSELQATSALRRGEYAQAYASWMDFLKRYDKSPFAPRARNKATEITLDVAEARNRAYAAAWTDSDKALTAQNSAGALSAWDNIPQALLSPLHDGEKSDFAGRVETQRNRVLSLEEALLNTGFDKADRFRGRNELLNEREAVQKLAAGRTTAGLQRVNERLDKIKALLDAARLAATTAVEQDRETTLQKRGQQALRLHDGLGQLGVEIMNRRWAKARQGVGVLGKDLSDLALKRPVDAFLADLDLASRADDALVSALERVRRRAAVTQIRLHAGFMSDDTRDPRIETKSGRITSVNPNDVAIRDSEGTERKFKLALVAAESMRTFLRDGSLDDRLCLTAWLLAVAMPREARHEAERLLATPNLPGGVTARAEGLRECEVLGQPWLRRLMFFAVRAGQGEVATFLNLYGGESIEAVLLKLQTAVQAGDAAMAREYIKQCSTISDPDLVSAHVCAAAIELLPDASRSDLELWLKFEPRNARAWLRLALWQKRESPGEYRRTAQKALELDPSLEEAWALTR